MDNTWFDSFQEEIELEADKVFASIREKKLYIQKLIGRKFDAEADYQQFINQHELILQSVHREIAALQRDIQAEKRKQQQEVGLITGIEPLLINDPEQVEIPIETIPEQPEIADDPIIDFTMFGQDPVPENPENPQPIIPTPKPESDNIIKLVTDMFLWIYLPRVYEGADDEFFTKRSVKLNNMKDNKLFDAVDILMRMPFEKHDIDLWYEYLPRKNKAGKSIEAAHERLYRFRLWDRMLDIGVKRAEAQSTSEPDILYQHFEAMKKANSSIQNYIGNMKTELEEQITELKHQLAELRDANK